jgi:hypothetical protein
MKQYLKNLRLSRLLLSSRRQKADEGSQPSPFSKREIERDFLIKLSLHLKREANSIAYKKKLNILSARCVI